MQTLERMKTEAGQALELASRMLADVGEVPPLLIVFRGSERPGILPVPMEGADGKDQLAATLRAMAADGVADGFIIIAESWISKPQLGRDGKPLYLIAPSSDPERGEVILVNASCQEGDLIQMINFSRDSEGKPVLGELSDLEVEPPGSSGRFFKGLWQGAVRR